MHAGVPVASWNRPAAHASHASFPTDAWNVPAAHAVHCSASLVLRLASLPRVPTPHALQNVALFDSWYMPTAHALQLGAFSADEYMPGAHSAHTRPLSRVPGEHEPQ